MPDNVPSSTTSNGVDCEPDIAWKENLRKRIEEGLQSMVADAKENHAAGLSKAPDTAEAHMRLEVDFREAMQTIKSLASEQYKLELDRERNQRRWTAGVPMTPGWSQFFLQEQQIIMNNIKQSNQTDNSVRTASESPTEERRSSAAIPKPSNEHPALARTITTPILLPVPPSPSVRPPPAEEREKPFVSPQSVHRGSDAGKKKEEERRDEVRRKEEDARGREEDARKKEEEVKRKEDASRKAEAKKMAEVAKEETKQRRAQLEQDTEKTKQMQLETQKVAEDLKKKEEEAHRKDIEMKEREDILLRREKELIRREEDNLRREEVMKQKEEEAEQR